MAWDWVDTVVTGAVGIAGIFGTLRASAIQSRAQRDQAREARQDARLEVAYNELLLKVDQVDDWAHQLTYVRWDEPTAPDTATEYARYPGYPELMKKTIGALGVSSVHWSDQIRELVGQMRTQMQPLYKAWLFNKIVRGERATGETLSADPVELLDTSMKATEAIIDLSFKIRDQIRTELNPATEKSR